MTEKTVRAYKSPFHAVGYSEGKANELMLKADLTIEIQEAIRRLGVTQTEAAKRAHERPATLTDIFKGRFHGYSTDRLLMILQALGANVRISVEQTTDGEPGTIAVERA